MNTMRRPYTFDRVVRIFFTTVCIVAVILLINYLRGVLLPFVVACILAYVLDPLVVFNKKVLHVKGRTLPTIFTLLEICGVLYLASLFLFPYIVSEINDMIALLQKYRDMDFKAKYIPPEVHDYIRSHIDINYLSSLMTREQWVSFIQKAANGTMSVVGTTFTALFAVVSWFVVLLYLLFLMIDYDKLSQAIKNAIPRKFRKSTLRVFNDIQVSMNHYFRGQSLIAFLVGVLFSIGFLIIKLPLGIVLGMFIGLLNLVPYLQLLSIPIALLLCLVSSVTSGCNFWILAGETILVYCIVQFIQDIILTPKIMGKYMGLNPAIILLALSVWGALLGFIGLIIALPLTSLFIAYYKEFVLGDKNAEAELLGKEPENKDVENKE